jgi:DNA-binding MarR family transcriptional regulator
MASKKMMSTENIDGLLKAMLVLSRTVESVLQEQAVEAAVRQPLSTSKVQILRLLGRNGGQTASQVARFLGVSNPAVSQIVDSMVRDKLILRKTAERDRREVNLYLTQQGRRWFRAVCDKQRHWVRSAIRTKQSREVAAWGKVMEDVAASLAQANNAFTRFCAQCGAHDDGTCVLVNGDARCLFHQEEAAAEEKRAARMARRAARTTSPRKTAAGTGRRKTVRRKARRR